MLEFHTAGESHGPAIITLIRGLPANLEVDIPFINRELSRRQSGFGSGGRMKIEKDEVEILGGVRWGKTLGGPVVLRLKIEIMRIGLPLWTLEVALLLPTKRLPFLVPAMPIWGNGEVSFF